MMGSFLTRGLSMIFGYAYPAYECYKTVEMNKPEIEQLRFWCQYWILVAALTVFERVGDTFISWVPMYSEAKLAFFIYLWYPKTKGTTYVYSSFFQPYLAKHETEIDRNLLELRTRAGDIAVLYCQRAASYGQTRVFEILQYVSAQSTSRPRYTQQQQQGSEIRQPPPAAPTRQPAATVKQQPQLPPTRTKSKSKTQHQSDPPAAQESVPPAPPTALDVQTKVADQPTTEAATSTESTESEPETMQIEPVSSLANGNANQPPKETVMEEAIRMTRGRLRKARAATTKR